MCVSPQRSAIFGHLNVKKCSETVSFFTFSLPNLRFATAPCNFSTSELQKVLRDRQFFNILTCERAFRHSGVQFFDMRTSKSAPKLRCFVHVHLQMCVSPQRRTIFRHLHFKKCSEHEVFCTFSLANVRFATAAYNFQTSSLQKVLRAWGVLRIFTCKCAFRHSGVQFLISPWNTDLRTRRFNRPTFRLTWHTNHWKNTAFRDFSNISRGCIFFLLTFTLLHLLSADLTTLLPVCFSSAFQKFLFKLPSINHPFWDTTILGNTHIWEIWRCPFFFVKLHLYMISCSAWNVNNLKTMWTVGTVVRQPMARLLGGWRVGPVPGQKGRWLFRGFVGDEILPSYEGIIMNRYKDLY